VKQFAVAKRRTNAIQFMLGDEEFKFKPIKVATAIMPVLDASEEERESVAIEKRFDWLYRGLGEAGTKRFKAILEDPDNNFDIPQVMELIDWLQEEVSGGRPTTSSDDS